MKSNTKSTESTASASPSVLKSIALCVGGGLIALLLALYFYNHVKTASYERLVPIAITIDLSYTNENNSPNEIVLEYDYGYGFIPAHRQSQTIKNHPSPQTIEFSIASWKPTGTLRLSVREPNGFTARSITIAKLDKSKTVAIDASTSSEIIAISSVSNLLAEISSAETSQMVDK